MNKFEFHHVLFTSLIPFLSKNKEKGVYFHYKKINIQRRLFYGGQKNPLQIIIIRKLSGAQKIMEVLVLSCRDL